MSSHPSPHTGSPTRPLITHVVGVVGGMGPAAGADFVAKFVQACTSLMVERGIAVVDQHFPEHWLVQSPIPDRTAGLLAAADEAALPLQGMLQAVARLAALGVRFVAIACNTAHAWHAQIQARFPNVEVLHVAQEVAAHLRAAGIARTGLLATRGTYAAGVYQQWFSEPGYITISRTASHTFQMRVAVTELERR
ncbi:MAG: aspartate/glutamate racemase family protein, partial [Comamonadaceae bacterium]